MTYDDRPRLAALAASAGIIPFYWDVRGVQHFATEADTVRLLAAMGLPAETEAAAEESERTLAAAQAHSLADPVVVCRESELPAFVTLRFTDGFRELPWRFLHDNGAVEEGVLRRQDVGELSERYAAGLRWEECKLRLPAPLGWGYHRLQLYRDGALDTPISDTLVVVSPERCFLPPELAEGARTWGVSAQLYGLRSEHSLGIGDIGDLRRLVRIAAGWGAAFVGLNPLHAVTPGPGPERSPYSPTSRQQFSPLYIDLQEAAHFLGAAAIEEYLRSDEIAEARRALNAAPLIDYDAVSALKFSVLERLYAFFEASAGEQLEQSFAHYVAERGEPLERYAIYAAIREYLQQRGAAYWNCRAWPAELRDPEADSVKQFRALHADRVRFYQFTQWLVEEQLRSVTFYAREQEMSIGLYMDLALGAGDGGAEAWMNSDLYAEGIGMGAPPDALAPQGQNWGLPPLIPQRFRRAQYEPFIAALQTVMRYSGAIRIDHAMSLFRLYWVPSESTAEHGAYVKYPLDDLMGILALESQQSRCLVIGEDLGTVPPEVRAAMAKYGVLSYKVLYFMHEQERFLRPEEYQREALVVTSTHDLPTLVGYFEGHDLQIRRDLELHAPEVLQRLIDDRSREREGLLKIFEETGFLSSEERARLDSGEVPLWPVLSARAHRFLAQSSSMLQGVQLEDLIGEREQANLPGTVDEHPNWKRRPAVSLEDLSGNEGLASILVGLEKRGRMP